MSESLMGALRRWSPLAVLALRRIDRLASHPIRTTSISQFILGGYLVGTRWIKVDFVNSIERNGELMYQAITRESIEELIHRFYDDVRANPTLGPVFEARIGDEWGPHLARMVEFWSSVVLGTGEFKGNVFAKHMSLQGVEPQHFRLWLDLFKKNVTKRFTPECSMQFMTAAQRIAQSLQYGYFGKLEVS